MVTAIGETVNEMTSPLYGADDHINKPFQLSELDFKIRRTLSQKRQPSSDTDDNADDSADA
jgi:DNA-binding response OmpR family regulator